MREPNRERKSEIKSINVLQLNEEQKEAKRLIIENQIVVITGRAGSGKSLVCAQAALDFPKTYLSKCPITYVNILPYFILKFHVISIFLSFHKTQISNSTFNNINKFLHI